MRKLPQGFYLSYFHTALTAVTMKYLEQPAAGIVANALESVKLPKAFQGNEKAFQHGGLPLPK